jgi:hypothetical protein
MPLAFDELVSRLRLDERFVGLDREPVSKARALADALINRWDKPWNAPHNGKCLAVFLALARADGEKLDPRFDRLLPAPNGEPWLEAAFEECLAALPEERRGPAMRAAIQRERGTVAVGAGLRVLARFPDVEVARHVIRESKTCEITAYTLSRVRPKLEALAKKHPQLAPALGGKAPPALEVLAVRAPTRATDLSPMDRAQLELAARKHDGKRVPAEKRFGPDDGSETSFGATNLFVTLGEKGQARYDAVLFAGDAGSVFRHGTTREVAARVQGDLEASSPDLAVRLADALARAEGARKKASPKKASPKKASPKKASPKKVSPKKASPKKASPKKASPKKASPKKVALRDVGRSS